MNQVSFVHFSVTHENGMTVRGVKFPATGGGRKPAVILSHGFNGCCADLHNRGEVFAKAGVHCFMFDFRGGGLRTTSDGALSEMMTITTECEDLKLVVDYVRLQSDVDTDNLFLMGESQGGLVSTLVAEESPESFRGLILWYPALMIPEASKHRLAMGVRDVFGVRLSPDFDSDAASIDPWRLMTDYKGKVLIVQGDRDFIVSTGVSEKALRLFPNASIKMIPGAGHGFGGEDFNTAINASVSFVKETVGDNR